MKRPTFFTKRPGSLKANSFNYISAEFPNKQSARGDTGSSKMNE